MQRKIHSSLLKNCRPRKSLAGKCHDTPKGFKPVSECIHYVARENTYKETAKICEYSEATVKRAMKQIHTHEEANFNTALNEIFDETERNEEYLTCKKIKILLNEQFNLFICLKILYCEVQRV